MEIQAVEVSVIGVGREVEEVQYMPGVNIADRAVVYAISPQTFQSELHIRRTVTDEVFS